MVNAMVGNVANISEERSTALSNAPRLLVPQIEGDDLAGLRTYVRALDAHLIDVIAARIAACLKIGEAKLREGLEVRNISVEARVISSVRSIAERRDLHPDVVEDIVRTIIDYSVLRQIEARDTTS